MLDNVYFSDSKSASGPVRKRPPYSASDGAPCVERRLFTASPETNEKHQSILLRRTFWMT